MKNHIITITNRIIEYSFYLLAGITPLLFTTVNYELFEFNKMVFVYAISGLITVSLLIKFFTAGSLKIKHLPLLLPLLLFTASQVISTFFSLDPYTSLWGYYSRFHGGLMSTICYLFIFYAFLTVFPKNKLPHLVIISLTSAFLVAAYGFAEHFGIDAKYWIQDVKNRVFSTLGQPNWLAAFLCALSPLTLGISLASYRSKIGSSDNKKLPLIPSLFLFLFLLFYLVLLYTGSRSGFIAFWLTLNIYWIINLFIEKKLGYTIFSLFILLLISLSFFLNSPSVFFLFWGGNLTYWIIIYFGLKNKFGKYLLVFLFLFMGITFTGKTPFSDLNSYSFSPFIPEEAKNTATGTSLETGISESGDIRKIVWKGAFDIAKSHPLIGTGTETFAYAYYLYRPAEHNLTSEWDFLYNKAHNEYLNILANNGFFGLASYLAFIFGVFTVFFKYLRGNYLSPPQKPIITGIFAGWLSILITNFFGFSVVAVALLFFLLPAVMIKTALPEESLLSLNPVPAKGKTLNNIQKLNITLAVCLGLLLEFGVIKMWLADYYFAGGYNSAKSEDMSSAYNSYKKAIFLNGAVPFYHSEMAYASSVMATYAFEQKEKDLEIGLVNEALREDDLALKISPNNVNYWKNSTKVYYRLSQTDEKYLTNAISSLEQARKLAPTDPKITYNLAVFYGKIGENDAAIRLLQKTIQLKSNYKDAHYAIALFYEETGKIDMAVKHLKVITEQIDPVDEEIKKKLEEMEGT